MNKVLKWVLIGLGIAVVAFGVALVAFRGFGFHPMMMGGRGSGFERGFGGMMFGVGFSMLIRLVLGLAVLGLAVFGVISLFRGNKKPAATNTPAVSSNEPVVSPEPEKLCAKCSKPVQADWKVCPYCGKKQ